MNDDELAELWKSIEEIIYSPTKKDAKSRITRLNFKVNMLRSEINDSYLFSKLNSVISYAESASGSIKDKANQISYVEQDWDTFENGIKLSRER